MSSFLIDIRADTFSALRDVWAPELRLFLYKADGSSMSGLSPLDVFGGAAGEVIDVWKPYRRAIDTSEVVGDFAVGVACQEPYTPEQLRKVRGFLLAEYGATTGTLYRCTPSGVVAVSSEASYRFVGTRVSDETDVPGTTGGGVITSDGFDVIWG